MEFILEEKQQLLYLISGVSHLNISDLYFKAVLGASKDGIVLYNDQMPSGSNQGNYEYKIAKKMLYSEIKEVVCTDIFGVKKLHYKKRIRVYLKTNDEQFDFFVEPSSYGRISKFFRFLNKNKVKTKTNKENMKD